MEEIRPYWRQTPDLCHWLISEQKILIIKTIKLKTMKKIMLSFAFVLGIFAFTSQAAMAAEFMAPEKDSGTITISGTETHHNLYTAGGTVLINSPVTGDLFVAGGNVTVEGSIEQDVMAAGGTVYINGNVGGDVRVAGGTVIINGKVSGDLLAFSGSVQVSDKSSIGGDVVICGGEANLNGPVSGKLWANGGKVMINSSVAGETMVRAESLVFGEKSNVQSKITYKGPNEAEVKDGAKVSSIDYQKMERRHGAGRQVATIFTIGFIIKLLAAIVFALLALYFFPRTSRKALDSFANRPWINLLVGVIGLIFIPIATIIVMVVLLGLYVGLLAIWIYLLFLMLAGFIAAVYSGAWVIQKLTKRAEIAYDWQAVVIGVVLFAILKFIPVLGWIVILALTLIAFGGLLREFYAYQKRERSS